MAKFLDKTGLNTLWAKIKSTFQTLGNLVTAWGGTPSDTKYPSEKLVKDSLDAISTNARTIPQDSSKGANLVVNGSGRMSSNYNFSGFAYLPTICYNGSTGSFGFNGTNRNNEFISCDFNKKIIFSADIRNLVAQPSNCLHRIYVNEYDIDKKSITSINVMYGVGTLTELTQDLNPGDTVVHLADLSNANWLSATTYHRGFIFWNYQNSYGYLYPPETYSRNVYPYGDSNALWDVANVNVATGTITLNSGWTGPAIPAGTKVSRRSSGGTYPYPASITTGDTEWHSLKGYVKGIVAPGTSERVSTKFSQGTAFIKVGVLPSNLTNTDAVTGIRAAVTNFFVYEESDINDGFGTLPVNRGGTGNTTANGAANSLLSALPDWTASLTDSVKLIRRDTGGSASFGQVTFLTVWGYIKDKISSVLGLTKTSYGGNAATSTASNYPAGFNSRSTWVTWGELKPTNEYTAVTRWDTASGGSVVFADKSGQTYMQIGGVFYQREGNYAVLDTSSIIDAAKVSGTVGAAATASAVSTTGAGTADAARHIWFSDSSAETKRVYNDNFKYNPVGNIVTANIAGNAATATTADSVSTAIGSGKINLLGVANNVAGNYQPKMHPTIRAFYNNDSNGNILMIGPERGTRGAADRGGVRLSGGTGYYTQLQTADFTADRWHKLPDESGNLAVTSGTYPNMSVGTADYASAAKSGSALAQAIAPDADVELILYGDSTYSSVKALYNAGKKLYLVTGGSIQPNGRFEYRIPLTQITYDANREVNAFYFEVPQDDRNGASEVGSIASYRLDSTGWTTTAKQVGYAVNAGAAVTYTSGGGIDTALQGKMATDGSNATNVAGGNIIRNMNDWTNPGDAELIAAASSTSQGKYTLQKLWNNYFKTKANALYAPKHIFKSIPIYDTQDSDFHDQNLRKQLGPRYSQSQPFILNEQMFFNVTANFVGIEFAAGLDFTTIEFEVFNTLQSGIGDIGRKLASIAMILQKGTSSLSVQIPFTWSSGSFAATLYCVLGNRITAGSANVTSYYYG